MKYFTISQAAGHLDVSIKTLRRWEKQGLIQPSRNPLNHRIYSQDDLERIKSKPPSHSKVDQDYLFISEAAVYAQVSIKTIRRWDKTGKLKSLRNNRNQRVFTKVALDHALRLRQLERDLPTLHLIQTTVVNPLNPLKNYRNNKRNQIQTNNAIAALSFIIIIGTTISAFSSSPAIKLVSLTPPLGDIKNPSQTPVVIYNITNNSSDPENLSTPSLIASDPITNQVDNLSVDLEISPLPQELDAEPNLIITTPEALPTSNPHRDLALSYNDNSRLNGIHEADLITIFNNDLDSSIDTNHQLDEIGSNFSKVDFDEPQSDSFLTGSPVDGTIDGLDNAKVTITPQNDINLPVIASKQIENINSNHMLSNDNDKPIHNESKDNIQYTNRLINSDHNTFSQLTNSELSPITETSEANLPHSIPAPSSAPLPLDPPIIPEHDNILTTGTNLPPTLNQSDTSIQMNELQKPNSLNQINSDSVNDINIYHSNSYELEVTPSKSNSVFINMWNRFRELLP